MLVSDPPGTQNWLGLIRERDSGENTPAAILVRVAEHLDPAGLLRRPEPVTDKILTACVVDTKWKGLQPVTVGPSALDRILQERLLHRDPCSGQSYVRGGQEN